ncbi:AMP-binding protein [Variovorax robiniae]|uniref:AMP-binding protein n=1 Tax=Variovorax robiniae TaxID=1836199 RepID=A0ABU8X650_9BURK
MTEISGENLPLQRLFHWERTAPQRVILTQPVGGGQLQHFTWAQVADQARRMATWLQAQGFEPGSRIGIFSKNCAWWLISDLAIWMAGHVSVPLYPTLSADSIRLILDHSEARACFIGKLDGWTSMVRGIPDDLPCVCFPLAPADAVNRYASWDAIGAGTLPLQGEVRRGADELATVIYTSGTTGRPKGVMHSFGTLAWAAQAGKKQVQRFDTDRVLSYLPMAHVAERVLVEQGWLATGMHIYFAESLETFASDLVRARPTLFFSVPRLWVKFQQGVLSHLPAQRLDLLLRIPIVGGIVRRKILGALGLDQCRVAGGGAAPMPLALLQWYRRLGLPINEAYGMTENLAVSHCTVPGVNQEGTVGPASEGVEARRDPTTGELQMRSPGLMLGYFKDAELTREAFTDDGWMHTGDKGEVDAQGCWRITGRIKDQFKTGKGKYVAPSHIEDRLCMHPAIETCMVAGANLSQPLGLVSLLPTAFDTEAARRELEPQMLAHLDDVNARLDPHEQLDCLVLLKTPWTVENGFLTPTLKVKRGVVEEAYAPRFEEWVQKGSKVVFAE